MNMGHQSPNGSGVVKKVDFLWIQCILKGVDRTV